MEFWRISFRSLKKLKNSNSQWLEEKEIVNLNKCATDNIPAITTTAVSTSSFIGRPKKQFTDCSKRSQRRRLAELSKVDDSAVSTLMDTSNHSDINTGTELSPDEVLSLFTEAKLTKHQYILIKEFINSKTTPILPSYHKILEAKKRCYPLFQTVTEK